MKKAAALLALAILATTICPDARAASGRPKTTAEKLKSAISFNFVETPLVGGATQLSSLSKLDIVVGPAFRHTNPSITLGLYDVSCAKAFNWIAKTIGADYSVVDEIVCFGTADFIKRCTKAPLVETDKQEINVILTRRISFDFVTTPLKDVAVFLKDLLKVKIVVLGGAADKELVTLRLRKVRAGVGMKFVGLLLDRRVTADTGIVIFDPPGKTRME